MLGSKKKNNRKWEKRPQLYRGRFFYVRQIAEGVLAAFVVGALACLWLYFQNSDALLIRKVTVSGTPVHITQDDVIKLSGIKTSDRLFTLDLAEVEQNILRYPWIAETMLRREFPDTIQIHVTERKPVALLMADALFLVDTSGKPFKLLEADDPADLPVISGIDGSFARTYPRLARQYLNQALGFLKMLQAAPFYSGNAVSEIHIDQALGFTVYLRDSGLEIYYGRHDLEQKQHMLEKFKLSQTELENRYVRLDLNTPGRIIARTTVAQNTVKGVSPATATIPQTPAQKGRND